MSKIHDSSVIDPKAKIGPDVEIGPFCTVGPGVTIGAGSKLISHVVVEGPTTIGENNTFYPGTFIGTPPQDHSYKGEKTRLEIGDHNVFRECVTLNRGTLKDEGVTIIGSHNMLMAYVHIGHDCILEDHITIANSCQFAGHVLIKHHANIGGIVGSHHFVTFGQYCYVAGHARIPRDVPPFTIVGNNSRVEGLNVVGLTRAGVSKESIAQLKSAYKLLFSDDILRAKAFDALAAKEITGPEIDELVRQLKASEAGRYGRAREAHRVGKAT